MLPQIDDESEAVLARAAEALRGADVPGWIEVANRAKAKAASLVRHSWPVRGQGATGEFLVSHRVLRALVRRNLLELPALDVDEVDLELDGERLVAATVAIVVRYGTAIPSLAAQVRARTAGVLTDALGPLAPPADRISIDAVDVTRGDPRLG